ncbi:hypothetical protein TWF694_002691 [Orbilia ellipsospora]|uniref:DUF6923 domain-containing protein n=1 Tax=Orbilia ellipsospora TaxID=2528407 RepID=A0AAV9X2U8_9PEZI
MPQASPGRVGVRCAADSNGVGQNGYYIGDNSLYSINVTSGAETPLLTDFTNDNDQANALGYNILDNYLYAIRSSTNKIIRISSDNVITDAANIPPAPYYNMGDFDSNGQYWVADGEVGTWNQINLNPFTGTYGAIIASGNFSSSIDGGFAYDWSYIPSAGPFLWTVASYDPINVQKLVRFDMVTHQWSVVATFDLDALEIDENNGYAATFAQNNGNLYLAGANTKDVLLVNVFSPTTLTRVGMTPDNGTNGDGARCLYYDIVRGVTSLPVQPTVTITVGGGVAGTTTEFPVNGVGSILTGIADTVTVVITTTAQVTLTTVTTTVLGTAVFTTTVTGSQTVSVIDYTTAPTTTITLGANVNSTTTYYPTNSAGSTLLTGTVTVVDFEVAPESTAASGPTFPCDQSGYILLGYGLYRFDIQTGNATLIKDNLIGPSVYISGIGYNSLDNYLYGLNYNTNHILRIAADGTVSDIGSYDISTSWTGGDIDDQGQYYLIDTPPTAAGNNKWNQLDLNPNSATYLQTVNSGTIAAPYSTGDWAFVPGTGHTLWAMVAPNGYLEIARFNITTSTWTIMASFSDIPIDAFAFGGFFAAANGDIYGYEDVTGEIYFTNVFTLAKPVVVSTGPSASGKGVDGARCVFYNIGKGNIQPTVTITTNGPAPGTTTEFPTNTAGQTLTGVTNTVTVVITTPQPSTTITLAGTSDHSTTLYPTNSAGSTVTDGSGTVTVVSYRSPPPSWATSGPTLPCDKYGYLALDYDLYKIDLETSNKTLIKTNVANPVAGGQSLYLAGIGFNSMDNYLYALDYNTNDVKRIAADGNITRIGPNTDPSYYSGIDVDGNGQMYAIGNLVNSHQSWIKIDLNPFSATYGQQVGSGTVDSSVYALTDWTSVPGSSYLWNLAPANGVLNLVKFDPATSAYSTAATYTISATGGLADGFGATFGNSNGTIYCLQNGSGIIYSLNVFSPQTPPTIYSQSSPYGYTDGARCVYPNIAAG